MGPGGDLMLEKVVPPLHWNLYVSMNTVSIVYVVRNVTDLMRTNLLSRLLSKHPHHNNDNVEVLPKNR